MNKSINIKIVISVLALMLFVVMVSPDNAFAGTRVTVYFAGGVVIGGVSIFFSIFIGRDRHHSKNEKKNEENAESLAEKYALNTKSVKLTEEDINQAGMVKILEW